MTGLLADKGHGEPAFAAAARHVAQHLQRRLHGLRALAAYERMRFLDHQQRRRRIAMHHLVREGLAQQIGGHEVLDDVIG